MSAFQKGSTFATFKEFKTALGIFSTSTSSLFVKKSSMKIKQPELAHLQYEYVRYIRKQGKICHPSGSSGARPNQKSFKTGCPASFRLICVRPKNGEAAHLVISKADLSAFQKGSTFATFKEFETALGNFSKSTYSLFVKKSSTKITQSELAHLQYEYVRYSCKQGKICHPSESSGARPNQNSFKTGCPASFRLICVRPKNGEAAHLVISKADFDHVGHEVSAHMYSLYPENRRVKVTPDVEMIAKSHQK